MRLTKDIKQQILDAALVKSGVTELEAAIRTRYAAWIEAVRVRVITPEVEKAIEAAKKCLEPYRNIIDAYVNDYTYSKMSVNVAGQSRDFYFNGTLDNINPTPNVSKRIANNRQTLTADDPLVQQLYDIDADSVTVREKRDSVTAAVNAYLNTATTVKALLKLWPECAPLIPTAVAPSGVNLPSVPVADLNKLVGLP